RDRARDSSLSTSERRSLCARALGRMAKVKAFRWQVCSSGFSRSGVEQPKGRTTNEGRLMVSWLLIICSVIFCSAPTLHAEERLRLLIETDAGGDPDDEQSLVRFLLYTCEWDVEGIIANRPQTRRPENQAREDTGYGIVQALVNAYGACWTNLVQHDPRYPK